MVLLTGAGGRAGEAGRAEIGWPAYGRIRPWARLQRRMARLIFSSSDRLGSVPLALGLWKASVPRRRSRDQKGVTSFAMQTRRNPDT